MFLALAGGFFTASTTWEACLTWMGSPSHLLQGILPTQGSNPDLLYCRQILYHLSHQGSSATVHGMAKGWTPLGNWKETMLFPVVMYGCESWTIKKAEHWRIDAFELWCWRRLLRVPWTTRRSNQFILKEISPEYSLGGLLLELKLQYFGYLMRSVESLENTWCWERLRAGEGGGREWNGPIASPNQGSRFWANSGRHWRAEEPSMLQSMGRQKIGHSNGTTKIFICSSFYLWLYSIQSYHHFPKVTWVSSFLPHSLCCSFIAHLNSFFTDFFLSWIPSISCFTWKISDSKIYPLWNTALRRLTNVRSHVSKMIAF